MARPLRIEYPNAVYHVTFRGYAWNKILGHFRHCFLVDEPSWRLSSLHRVGHKDD